MKLTTTPQPTIRPSALAVMAGRFNVEPAKLLQTLKSTVFKGATDDELLALVVVANEYGLNPLTKEIYAFPAKGGGIVPVVSIDGWINRMNSNPQFDGIEFEDVSDESTGKPVATTAVIWRKDRTRPVKITEYFAECKRNTEPWNAMPHRMLRHKALCQAVRVAFGFSGVYDEDEATRIASLPSAMPVINVAPKSDKATEDEIAAFVDKKNAETAEAVKRHRRTKAEMEAARAAEKTEAEPAQPAAVSYADMPSDRERLSIAVQEAGYTELQAMKCLRDMRIAAPNAASYADLPDDKVAAVLSDMRTLIEVLESVFSK